MKGSFLITATLVLLLSACAPQGFESSHLGVTAADDKGKSSDSEVPTPPPSELNLIESMKSTDQTYNSEVYIDKTDWTLVMKIPLGFNPFIDVTQIPVPQLRGAQVSTVVDANLNYSLIVKIPLKNIMRGVTQLETANKLPNGDPLPKMPAGEPASLGLTISAKKNVKVNLYIAVEAVGVLIDTPFDYPFPAYLSLPLKNEAQTQILGWFTLIPRKNNNNSGFFLSFKLPAEVSLILNKYL